jgi:hypothetical protein
MVRAFSPHFVWVARPGAGAPGWYGDAPLALKFLANHEGQMPAVIPAWATGPGN